MAIKKADVIRLLFDVHHVLKNQVQRHFEYEGITMPQGMVIGMLFRHKELKISELSKNLGLSNSTVSGIVDRLEKQQIVERVRGREDRRVVWVRLTPSFIKRHKDFHKSIEHNFERMLEHGTDEEMEKIMEGLTILKQILHAENRSADR